MSKPLSGHQFKSIGAIKRLPIASLTPTQVDLVPEKVHKLMKAKDAPPISVDALGNVQDGHHRLAAEMMKNRRYIQARVIP